MVVGFAFLIVNQQFHLLIQYQNLKRQLFFVGLIGSTTLTDSLIETTQSLEGALGALDDHDFLHGSLDLCLQFLDLFLIVKQSDEAEAQID